MTAAEWKLAEDQFYQRLGVYTLAAITLSRGHGVGLTHRDGMWCVSVHTGKSEFVAESKRSLLKALDRALERLHLTEG